MANLTKAQRSAIGKKAARTRKRNANKTTMNKSAHSNKRRKRRTPAKSGFLSEMFNPKLTQAGVKSVVSGAVGGMGAVTILKMTPGQTPVTQAIILGVSSFVTSTFLKMPNVGAGVSAVGVYKLMENAGMLNEEGMELAQYADPIEQLPMVLDEQGNEMYLDENDNLDLSESYEVGYFTPGFGGEGYVMS